MTPLALNQRSPFSRARLRSCSASVESSVFQGSGSQLIFGCSRGCPGSGHEETGGSFLLQGEREQGQLGDCSCSAHGHARLLEPALQPPEWLGGSGGSGITCKKVLAEPLHFSKLVSSAGGDLVVPLCALRKEPGSSLAGAAAD